MLVMACKRDKTFLNENPVLPILAKNCPKLAFFTQNPQNGGIACIFIETLSLEFYHFMHEA